MKVLILGGTTEASALVRALEGDAWFQPVLSLAGRTRAPVLPAAPSRRGGFGGVAGLVGYLRDEGVGALVDATHPYAAQMHRHAAEAAAEAGVARVAVSRPAWVAGPGDRWIEVADMGAAVEALDGGVFGCALTPAVSQRERGKRVFLTVGQQELTPFRAAPWHEYLIRSVEAPDPGVLPPRARCIAARGPFLVEEERALLEREGIEVVVTKNSGGAATAAKLEAARQLGLPVVLVARPVRPAPPVVEDVAGALAWLHQAALDQLAPHQAALRGV
jgi:precorrin-6A/cobalt-precorrin-6A reductase